MTMNSAKAPSRCTPMPTVFAQRERLPAMQLLLGPLISWCAGKAGRREFDHAMSTAQSFLFFLILLGGAATALRLLSRRAPTVPYPVLFFFQAEDGIRDLTVTGVQTCALPI